MKQTLLPLALLVSVGCAHAACPDSIYMNGKIYTVNVDQEWAQALAIKDGKFFAVGSNEQVKKLLCETTNVINLDGSFVMPGISDSHIHPADVYRGEVAGRLVFGEDKTKEEIKEIIKDYIEKNPKMKFIRAEKYSIAAFPNGKMTKDFLDEINATRPIMVMDETYHNATANSAALKLAGITKDTPNPPLGVIDKDPKTGEPTGYLSETGIGLVGKYVTRNTIDELKEAVGRSLSELSEFGVTSFVDMLVWEDLLVTYNALESDGQFPFRAIAATALNEFSGEYITEEEGKTLLSNVDKYQTDRLKTKSFKYFADGTPTSLTSLMVAPYVAKDGDPAHQGHNHGEMTMTEPMKQYAINLMANNVNAHYHSVGDGTSREVLNMVEEAHKRNPKMQREVHIGHNTFVHPDDIPRYKELGVNAEFSPPQWFPTPMTGVVEGIVGKETMKNMYPIKQFIDAGVNVSYGSDWPAGTPTANPWRAMEGLVTRMDPSGKIEGQLGDPITLPQAIFMMTQGGANTMQMGDEFGSIETGKYADFVVLDRDLFEIDHKDIDSTKVKKTIFNGEIIYQSK